MLAPLAPQDPNAPKKPLSAFMAFSQEMRDQVKSENPDMEFKVRSPCLFYASSLFPSGFVSLSFAASTTGGFSPLLLRVFVP